MAESSLAAQGGADSEQPAAWRGLCRARARCRVHQALLIVGHTTAQAGRFARAWAQLMLCAGPLQPRPGLALPCGSCPSCRAVVAGHHPDLLLPTAQGQAAIDVAAVRALCGRLTLMPALAPLRVVLIEAAERMQRAAHNALLKSLEEPPPHTHFLLSTGAYGQLAATLRSRCQAWLLQPAAAPQVAAAGGGQAQAAQGAAAASELATGLGYGQPGTELALGAERLPLAAWWAALDQLPQPPSPRLYALASTWAREPEAADAIEAMLGWRARHALIAAVDGPAAAAAALPRQLPPPRLPPHPQLAAAQVAALQWARRAQTWRQQPAWHLERLLTTWAQIACGQRPRPLG